MLSYFTAIDSNERSVEKMAVLFFALCLISATVIQISSASPRPNVLFLVVDDLRPELGCYGKIHMVTPNIDQLASKSVRFDRAYVQEAVCSPSRTSFLTGRRPDTTRIFDLVNYFRNISGNFTTLPEHFKNNGYITQSSGKIFHPGTASNKTDDYPYSWTYPAYHARNLTLSQKGKVCPGEDGKLYRNAVCPVDLKTVIGGSLPDIKHADFTIQFLKNRSMDNEPFFMAMGYLKPHLSFRYPKEYQDLYPLSEVRLSPNPYYPPWLPEVAWTPWDELRQYDDIIPFNISYPFGSVPVDYQLKLRQSYYAAASFTDAQVGRVLDALDQYGFANNTIITFHGDHGWQLGDHGEWCKHTNFDIATRTPMLVYVPGVTAKPTPPGKTFPFQDAFNTSFNYSKSKNTLSSDALVEAVDLYATISELAGLDVPPTCPSDSLNVTFCTEGSSLVPIIKNLTMTSSKRNVTKENTLKWKSAIFSQFPRPSLTPNNNSMNPVLPYINIMGYTMRTDEYRYTEWMAYNHTTFTADWDKVYARELYIYSTDPLEDVNVAEVAGFQDLTRTLSDQLRGGWRKALPKPGPQRDQ